jgi:hypothetical protein
MKTTLALTLMLALVLSACSPEKRINNKEDIEQGTKVVNTFLGEIQKKNYDKAMESTNISKENPEFAQHVVLFKKLNSDLGDIVDFKQDTAKAEVDKGIMNTEGVITLKYTVNYQRGNAKQDYIVTYDNGDLKILSYTIGDRVYYDMKQ